MEIVRLSDEVAYADQPSFQELRRVRELGYRTLIDARLPTEHRGPEEEDARRVGLRYVSIPVAQADWRPEHFERLAAVLADRDRLPALVHCARGARSGILALTWLAAQRGWTIEQLEDVARPLGLEIPRAAREWLRRRSAAYVPAAASP